MIEEFCFAHADQMAVIVNIIIVDRSDAKRQSGSTRKVPISIVASMASLIYGMVSPDPKQNKSIWMCVGGCMRFEN